MENEPKDINSIRLRVFLDLITREHGEQKLADGIFRLSENARKFCTNLDDNAWLTAEVEAEIIYDLNTHFEEGLHSIEFNQTHSRFEASVGNLNRLISEVSRKAPELGWQTRPKDAFVRQVIARSSQLFHDKRELSTAVEYLNMANDELEKQLADNKNEMMIAGNIQKGFVPSSLPDWEGLQFWVHYQPVGEVSGDLYDYYQLDDSRLALILFDVSGHGVPAALISSIAKIAFLNNKLDSPSDVFSNVNLEIINHVRMEGYLTAFYLIIDTDYNMTYSIAGIPAPILYRAETNSIEQLEGTGTLIGMFPDASKLYSDHTIKLDRGDKLFIYTDGLSEAYNPQFEFFNEPLITSAILETSGMDIENSCEHILKRYREFILGSEARNDLTLIGMMVSENREDFKRLITKARRLYRLKAMDAACHQLRACIKLFPREPNALYLLGKYLTMDGKYQEAIDTLKQYNALMPKDPNSYTMRAFCNYKTGRFDAAENDLIMSLNFRGENPSALYNLVKVLLAQDRRKEAKEIFAILEKIKADDKRIQSLKERM